MTSLSKLHDKCEKCKYKNDCNEKRMVACAVMELPPNIGANIKAPIKENIGMPIAREHTSITINMGEYGTVNTSLEELSKRLEENFYKHLRCDFNETL
ncbi:hypothetical protein [Tissierella praeacuta]|uniref:hypothetical protein n=1 Tax=Tissierella praeacuta TaxID=43131 RepID=UPI0028A7B60D|nr:hypothetical protein [Tissierella praeacuta]